MLINVHFSTAKSLLTVANRQWLVLSVIFIWTTPREKEDSEEEIVSWSLLRNELDGEEKERF